MNWLVEVLRDQRERHVDGNVYKACQCDFAYNSNHMEGSTLTHDQTVQVFDRGTFAGTAKVDDIVGARNHFNAFDHVIDTFDEPLTGAYLKGLHGILKRGTSDDANPIMAVGDYKRASNVIVGAVSSTRTASPKDVPRLMSELFSAYERSERDLRDILDFHVRMERIHPFSDGNGRVGRLVMFKECLRSGLTPFIITDDLREFYLRGIREWGKVDGYLSDTCGHAQDVFAAEYLPLAREWWGLMQEERPEGQPNGSEAGA